MDTYTITLGHGLYSVMATSADCKQRLVATCPTEDLTVALLNGFREAAPITAHYMIGWPRDSGAFGAGR